ncbi:hypothetical protein EJ02DRAFT_452510 [Clathrospora elynae]|uniref:Tautomerase cis-CaaD-like domain-containing protein n=1 Tax=Clathrospora elynae TaxID=706981 RepID=A0A6A5SX31_9PLEO|nr:hypothetical protein EJ02DRAFT_452510 [Clathrospora elynae]
MPHYEIHHSCPLDKTQYQSLTTAITNLHCRLFTAPSAFVNITFHHTSNCKGRIWKRTDTKDNSYPDSDTQYMAVGGQKVWTNYIIGHLRPRGPDNREKLNELVQEIMRIWDMYARPKLKSIHAHTPWVGPRRLEERNEEIARKAGAKASNRLDDARALHNVFIMEDIAAGMEQGFVLPVAGQDGAWVEENMEKFEQRAKDGDASMKALVEEIKGGLGKGPVERSRL